MNLLQKHNTYNRYFGLKTFDIVEFRRAFYAKESHIEYTDEFGHMQIVELHTNNISKRRKLNTLAYNKHPNVTFVNEMPNSLQSRDNYSAKDAMMAMQYQLTHSYKTL